LRVLQITSGGFYREIKGLYEYKLCNYLRNRGISLEILSLNGEAVDGFNVISLESNRGFINVLHSSIPPLLISKMLTGKFDLINAHSTIWNPLSYKASIINALTRRKPFVLTSHNFYPDHEIPLIKASKEFLKSHNLKTLKDGIVNIPFTLSDHIICMTNAEKKYLCGEFHIDSHKITVIPNGVNLTRFSIKPSFRSKFKVTSKHIVLYAGQLIELKGVEYFVEMAATIVKEGIDDVAFVMITHNPALELKLVEKAKKLGINDKLFIYDFNKLRMQDNDLVSAYLDCDLVVLPSFVETFPNVVLEAMAAGKPTVATNVCGMNEVVEDGVTGYLVNFGDTGALAEKAISLLIDKRKALTIGKKAQQIAREKYDFNKVGESVVNVYAKTLYEK
jgi:glycosyltransferase involved in cell wall biosynthesis